MSQLAAAWHGVVHCYQRQLTCMVCGLPCVVCIASLWYCQAVHGALATLTAVQAAVPVRQAAVLHAR